MPSGVLTRPLTDWNTVPCTAGLSAPWYGSAVVALALGIVCWLQCLSAIPCLRSAWRRWVVTGAGRSVVALPVRYVFWPQRVQDRVGRAGLGGCAVLLECLCSAWLSTWAAAGRKREKPFGGLYHDPGGRLHVCVERGAALYGEQLQLAPGSSMAMVWQMLAALVFLSAMVRALCCENFQRLPAVRGRDLYVPALLLLGTAPGAGAAVPLASRQPTCRGAVWPWHVLHRRAGAFHCGAGGRK